jgi:hypothetical protein
VRVDARSVAVPEGGSAITLCDAPSAPDVTRSMTIGLFLITHRGDAANRHTFVAASCLLSWVTASNVSGAVRTERRSAPARQ